MREAIRTSRTHGHGQPGGGLEGLTQRPRVLVSASAVGYYGNRGAERLTEDSLARQRLARPGLRRLGERGSAARASWTCASACCAPASCSTVAAARWRRCCRRFASASAARSPAGASTSRGSRSTTSSALYLAAIDDDRYDGPFNATAPTPVTNAELSRALGRALHRPAVLPVPAAALKLLYGEMAEIVTDSQNAVPARALALGHRFEHPGSTRRSPHALADVGGVPRTRGSADRRASTARRREPTR